MNPLQHFQSHGCFHKRVYPKIHVHTDIPSNNQKMALENPPCIRDFPSYRGVTIAHVCRIRSSSCENTQAATLALHHSRISAWSALPSKITGRYYLSVVTYHEVFLDRTNLPPDFVVLVLTFAKLDCNPFLFFLNVCLQTLSV